MQPDYEKPYRPLVSTLERFAQDHGATLTFVIDPEPWTDPHYRLVWLNSGGQMCSLRVYWLGDDEYNAQLQRWGIHSLLDEEGWRFRGADTAPTQLDGILRSAWARTEKPMTE